MQTATQELLQAIGQLPVPELDDLVMKVLELRAKRHVPALDPTDSQLLAIVNTTLTPMLQVRFNELVVKRQSENITSQELQELIEITDQAECLNADRMIALSHLAQRRHQTLPEIMQALGIQTPACV